MESGDLIYTIISLLVFVFILMNPQLKKFLQAVIKNKAPEPPPQEKVPYQGESLREESPPGERTLLNEDFPLSPPLAEREPKRSVQKEREEKRPQPTGSPRERLEELPPLKRALLWSEILAPPPGY
ncbi:MAG: hypothetical protein PQJ60_15200 [Spirochaetales bacterium]|nr:hypothetical protein [Spirochaetales bacterium]